MSCVTFYYCTFFLFSTFTSDAAAEYFDANALMKLLDDHKSGAIRNQRKIWTAYTFLTWHKQFME